MVTKTDLFNVAKSLIGKFILPAILRSTAYGILCGLIFFLAGLLVYNFGPGVLLEDSRIVWRLLVAVLVVTVYSILGIIVGLTLGGSSSVGRKLPDAQAGIHMLITPITNRIIERIPIGQEGIPLDKFARLVDTEIASLASESEPSSRALSIANFAARFLLQRLLKICRALFLVEFLRTLQENGESRINIQSVEGFARRRLLQFVINDIRLKLYVLRKITFACAVVLVAVPMVLIGLRLAMH
ncbi:MAG: hypothetical protein QOF62_1817 [Pyrinomonadaceae bacterium]|jgi:hypothetical protein|nr:hypothetical protein [Pyrinomonadaceae bacterium]